MIGDHGDVTVTLLEPDLEEKEEDKKEVNFHLRPKPHCLHWTYPTCGCSVPYFLNFCTVYSIGVCVL